MKKRAGPLLFRAEPIYICDGCEHLKTSMKMRGTRGSEDFWDCGHEKRVSLSGHPRNIGAGSGHVQTPDWCPFLEKGASEA